MQKLPKNFGPSDIIDPVEAKFRPAFNVTLMTSFNADMLFTKTQIYFIPYILEDTYIYEPVVVDIAEITSYGKKGLFGYFLQLNSGEKLTLANVGRKMREGITAALDERKG